MVITHNKANQLYWLGRYEERVYMTLHLLRKVNDKMIDGSPEQYQDFWHKMDLNDSYSSTMEFTLGMMYDNDNPSSIISSLNRAMDNAIMLRGDIKSETGSYIEMSLALLRRYKKEAMNNVSNLQPLTDWALAFWGSALHRIDNPTVSAILTIGRKVEYIDMLLRFDYPLERVAAQFTSLHRCTCDFPEFVNTACEARLLEMLKPENIDNESSEFRTQLICDINSLVTL